MLNKNKHLDRYGYLYAAFFFPALVLMSVYASFSVYPFGSNSLLVLDMNAQYIYFFEAFRDAFLGDGSLMYSFSRNLGGEMFGTLGYYLASPFSLITLLFPKEMITEAILAITLVKCGLCGLTGAYYLHVSRKVGRLYSFLFAMLYALSAYFVVQAMNIMWLDAMLILPLIMLGIEQLISRKRFMLYTLALAYGMITNFYIGFMLCIFSAIYFLYYLLAVEGTEDGKTLSRMVRFGIFSLISVAISAVMLLPVYYSLSLGKFEFSTPDFSFKTQFAFLDVIAKMLPAAYDTVRPEGLPFVYCGMLALFMLPLYFINPIITAGRKAGAALVIAGLILCFNIRPVDMVWHGFQQPNWLPYRYSFMLSFFILVLGAQALEKIRFLHSRTVLKTYAALIALVVLLDKLGFSFLKREDSILFALICLTFYLIAITLMDRTSRPAVLSLMLAMVCGVELFVNGLSLLASLNTDVVFSRRPTYVDFMEETRPEVEQLKQLDSGFYRVEKLYHRTVNDPMALGIYGLSHSNSTLNAKTTAFLKSVGIGSRDHWTKYAGATPVTNMFLGVKYLLTKGGNIYGYAQVTDDIVSIYENDSVLPIVFASDTEILYSTAYDPNHTDPFEVQNSILRGLTGEEDSQVFIFQRPMDISYDNVTMSTAGDHDLYTKEKRDSAASVSFRLEGRDNMRLYAYYPSTYQRKADVILNDRTHGSRYFDNDSAYIIDYGRFDDGEEIFAGLRLAEDNLYLSNKLFYFFDENLFERLTDNLLEQNRDTVVTMHSQTRITATVATDENQLVMTSIPYETGWNVKVDGKKVPTTEVLGALLAVEVPPGVHTVEFSFMPKEFVLGCIISVSGFVLLVCIYALTRRGKRRPAVYQEHEQQSSPESPEDETGEAAVEMQPDPDQPVQGDDEPSVDEGTEPQEQNEE